MKTFALGRINSARNSIAVGRIGSTIKSLAAGRINSPSMSLAQRGSDLTMKYLVPGVIKIWL